MYKLKHSVGDQCYFFVVTKNADHECWHMPTQTGSDLSSEIVPFIPMVQLTVLVVGEWCKVQSGSRLN